MAQLNVDKLPAGHELDALTAERVFNWKDIERRKHQPWGKKGQRRPVALGPSSGLLDRPDVCG